ncbi:MULTISPECIES: SH3 domain-containing protein [unclassified Cytobacillus]|uniref:SH3 domain-containing protein n=1 Tax=unclassified Cytobacillus TaxID=2675268 RepID=UPI00203F0902|nr:SH3 domain-containing protein [Cytobacillus sp. AMY 15.2]MCM3092555.1 SH3 domain-containing protein [Cytobacillus sp. AMY 15.2]
MKKAVKLFNFYFLALLLLLQSAFIQPAEAFAADSEEPKTAVVFSEKIGSEVELYQDKSIESEIVILLEDDTEVTILEEGLEFTYVKHVDLENGTTSNGYVKSAQVVDVLEADEFRNSRITSEEASENVQDDSDMGLPVDEEVSNTEEEETLPSEEGVEQPAADQADNTDNMPSPEQSDAGDIIAAEGEEADHDPIMETEEQAKTEVTIKKANIQSASKTMTLMSTASKSLQGIGVANPTHVYKQASASSGILKSYEQGTLLKYETYTAEWHRATVYISGKATVGYIKVSDVENIQTKRDLTGVGIKSPINVYSKASRSSAVLKSYPLGSVLKFRTLTSDWYEATVYINGAATIGYISRTDVEQASARIDLQGVALKQPTSVYSSADSASRVLKSYSAGTVLKYSTLIPGWYEATVYIKGKATRGFIKQSDVENAVQSPVNYSGVGKASPTKVYQRPSAGSSTLKSYPAGTVLKYQSFITGWYSATVYINGKKTTGYIQTKDVQNSITNPEQFIGVGLTAPTKVYQSPSTGSNTLKGYAQGSILKYESFVTGWYSATVYINGKKTTGYIKASDVENSVKSPATLTVWGSSDKVNVYTYASRNASVLKSYNIGSELKVQTFTASWHKATVYVNGKAHTGYINVSDVRNEPSNIVSYTQYGLTLNEAVNKQLQLNPPPQTDSYRNANGFIHSSLADIVEKGATTTEGVRIRTSPNLDNDSNVYGTYKKGTTFTILGKVQGTVVSGSNIWFKISYNGKTLYVHSSLVEITNVAVVKSSSNIRESATTSSHSYGIASAGSEYVLVRKLSGSTVSGSNVWYEIQYNVVWRNAKSSDIIKYLDPSQNDRFQHLLLDKSVGVSAAELNKVLLGKGILDGKGQAFIEAGKTHSVNEIYLISHALLETGHGISPLATGIEVGKNSKGELALVTSSNRSSLTDIKVAYNMFGIGAKDIDPERLGAFHAYNAGWTSPEKAIIGGAQFISNSYFERGQNTLYKMRWNHKYTDNNGWLPQYATDMGWAVKQVPNLKSLYEKLDNPILHFEIVQYK